MEEFKKTILKSLLTPDARARLSNIALVKPKKAAMLENYLCQNSSRLRRVDEKQLIGLLGQMGGGTATKIVIQRRASSDSDEDDNDDDLL